MRVAAYHVACRARLWHRRRVNLLLLALLGTSLGADPPLDRSLCSVRVVGGMTPYRLVTYEALWRGPTAVASHTAVLVNYEETLQQMRLIEQPAYEKLLADVESAGAFELPDAPEPPHVLGGLRYEVEVQRGSRSHTFKVSDPSDQPDPRYRRIVGLITRLVLSRTGPLVFRNVFFEPGTFGFLNLTSLPAARVAVDGRDLGQETPIYGWELSAGFHEVVLTDPKSGYSRKHTLKVEPGVTTILHVDLR